MQSVKTAIGLMSGTSMDGIDAALIESDGASYVKVRAHKAFDYPQAFRQRLKQALEVAHTIRERHQRPAPLPELERDLTFYHAQRVHQLLAAQNLQAEEVDLIGFHGQTILHRPDEGLSVQLGLGAQLAHQTGIDVIFDMRSCDMAHGGQGAPLTPAYHTALAMSLKGQIDFPCCFVNIGGIANLTYIPGVKDDIFAHIMAFDCGPGNCLIDQWMESRTGLAFDVGGQAGLRGRVDEAIISSYVKHDFFSGVAPKSFDWRDFSPLSCEDLSMEDGAATLAHLTARSIFHSFRFLPEKPKSLIISGGGSKNACLMMALVSQADRLGAKLMIADDCGLQADFMEAEAWAYLAIRSVKGLPLSFPATTGVQFPVTGGVFASASQ